MLRVHMCRGRNGCAIVGVLVHGRADEHLCTDTFVYVERVHAPVKENDSIAPRNGKDGDGRDQLLLRVPTDLLDCLVIGSVGA